MFVLEESTIQYFFLIKVYFYEIFEIFKNVVFCIRHPLAASGNIFWTLLWRNDEWCHVVLHIGSSALFSFHCMCFFSIYFSISIFFSYFFVNCTTCYGIEVNLSILKNKAVELFLVSSVEFWGMSCFRLI